MEVGEVTKPATVFQSPKYQQGGIVIRSPNADIGRDPRAGEELKVFTVKTRFNGTMVVAFVKGLQAIIRSTGVLLH